MKQEIKGTIKLLESFIDEAQEYFNDPDKKQYYAGGYDVAKIVKSHLEEILQYEE